MEESSAFPYARRGPLLGGVLGGVHLEEIEHIEHVNKSCAALGHYQDRHLQAPRG